MTNREIADHFVLSTRTVEKHVANALMKLQMHSRVELAVWATTNAP
jgi:non-specific serine/threonine protein kinase